MNNQQQISKINLLLSVEERFKCARCLGLQVISFSSINVFNNFYIEDGVVPLDDMHLRGHNPTIIHLSLHVQNTRVICDTLVLAIYFVPLLHLQYKCMYYKCFNVLSHSLCFAQSLNHHLFFLYMQQEVLYFPCLHYLSILGPCHNPFNLQSSIVLIWFEIHLTFLVIKPTNNDFFMSANTHLRVSIYYLKQGQHLSNGFQFPVTSSPKERY